MKLARHHARAQERERPSLHGAVNVLGFVLAMPILREEILVPRGQQLGMLREDRRRQLLLFPTRTRRQQPGLLGRLHQQLVQLNIKAIRRGGLCNFQYRHFRHRANVLPSFLSFNRENQLVAVRGCYRQLLRRSHGHARQAFLAVHQIVDMQHEIRCYPGVPMNLRYRIEQVAQVRMLGNVVLDVLQPFAGGLQRLLEFHASLDLGFAQRHLHAAVRVDLPFAGSFYGQENHLLEVVGHSRLYAVRLRRRHAPERLQRQHHVAETVLGIPDVLADFEMSFTPTRELVVEGVRHVGHFFLVDEVVGDVAQALHHAMVLTCVDTLAQAPQPLLLAELQLVRRHLMQLVPLYFLIGSIERPAGSGARLRLVHHVHHPGPDRLDQHLRTFTLQEFEHVEVAIALGDLRPELADDLDHRLHAQAVHLDGGELLADSRQRLFVGVAVKLLADLGQRVDPDLPLLTLVGTDPLRHPLRQVFVVLERLAIAQQGAQLVDGRLKDFICPALLDFVRTDTVDHLVHDVAEVEGIEHAHAEVHRELQPGFARGCLHAVVLLEQEHAEPVKTGVSQSQAIFRLVHAEAARTTRAGGKEDVVVDDLFFRHPPSLQALEVLHKVANSEVRRVALTVVAVFLAELERRHIRHRQDLAAISAAFKHRLNYALVFPGQATEKNSHLAALFRSEGLFGGAAKMAHRATVEAHHAGQARALLRQLPLDLLFGLRTRQFIYGEIDASHGHSNFPL